MAGPSQPSPAWWRDRKRLALLGVGVLVVAAGAVAAYELLKRPGDVLNEDVPFRTTEEKKPTVKRTDWTRFGSDRARTRYLAAKGIKPPFKRVWKYGDRPLLEFPPIYAKGRLWAIDNNGYAFSLDARTGKVLWKRRIATKSAASPTYARGRVFVVTLEPGKALALNAKTGKTIWKRDLPGRAESSPIVIGRSVYFGSENGQLFSLSTRNGNVRWATTLTGPVKAAPAYRRGTLFVGDYGGTMSAVNARTGEIRWQSNSQGAGFGVAGRFYSTPAIAFGRVYSGNNDGRIYSFDAKTGALAWSHSTGGYVYSGPAVADTPNTPPTVYVGSFDGNVYALDARDGSTRWTASMGAQISGSLSVVGTIVYASTIADRTEGFKVGNGHRVYERDSGAYTPVISDGRWIYLTGYSSITALRPIRGERGSRQNPGASSRRGRDKPRSGRSTRKGRRPPARR
jgi:outer membrane protein assembly factor BamB